jgi:uncharacterized damage-inducible protein DinB
LARKRIEDALAALRGAFERKGWHGPTVLEAVRGVTPRQAARTPRGAHNSIHQLVDHIAYWERIGIEYLRRGAPPSPMPPDWRRPRTSLAASIRALRATHRELVRRVARLTDRDLDRKVRTSESGVMPLGEVLHGIAAHDVYHAGQIRLLRAMLEG